MFSKIKFIIIATIVFSLGYSAYNIDWNLINYKNERTFEQYIKNDKEYQDIKRLLEENNGLIHPLKELELKIKEWMERDIVLVEEYKTIQKMSDLFKYYKKCFFYQITLCSTWLKSSILACTMVLLPLIIRAVLYWCVAPILEKKTKMSLFDNGCFGHGKISIRGEGEKNIKVEIQPNTSLIVVDENFVNGVEADSNLEKSMRWLFSWKYPIMSFFCKLRAMNEYKNSLQTPAYIDITSNDPDDYFIEVDLNDCDGAFIVPSNIKAFSPTLNIECKWRLFSLVSLIMFRFRYYVISGTGKLVLSSSGGFANRQVVNDYVRRKPSSLIFADANLKWNAARTELWYPYVIRNGDLFDLLVQGEGNYLISNTIHSKALNLTSPESILNVLGKLAGF